MTLLHRLASIVRWIFRRNRAERDLNDELQAFVDMAAADEVRDGATPAEARRLAVLQLGGMEQAKERVRGGRHGAWLDVAGRDVRYGLRQVRRNPAFSAIAIATLALGIGGMTAMFSAFDAVLVRPLPYADADRLVMVWDCETGETDITSRHNSTPAEWIEWRRLNTVFTDLASQSAGRRDALRRRRTRTGPRAEGHVDVLERAWRAADARACLHRGRGQQERARRRDQPRTVAAPIRRRIRHRRPQISLNDEPYEVIGVMPRNFYFMPSREIDIWMPASFPPWMRTNFTWHDAQIVARLKPGVTLEQARQSMAALSLQVTAKDFRGPAFGRSSCLCGRRSRARRKPR